MVSGVVALSAILSAATILITMALALDHTDHVALGIQLCDSGKCEQALSLLQKAHEDGTSQEAAGAIAWMFLSGKLHRSTEREGSDYETAVEWLEKGATLGDPDCHRALGFLHATGLGFNGTVSMPQSNLHYYFGAKGGCMECVMVLGFRHLNGYGLKKNCDSAVAQYIQAASEAVTYIVNTSHHTFERIRLIDESNRHKIIEESKDVIHYFEHAADGGDVNAQLALGQLTQRGLRGVPRNLAKAAQYYERAAVQGEANAMAHLGSLHVNGEGVPQNNQTALLLFKKSAALGSAAGYTGLGFIYMQGRGVEKNVDLALKYYKEAADLGSAEAQYELGMLYLEGNNVDTSYSTALHYFTAAGHQGHTPSLFNLAQLHLSGLGTIKSCSLAVRLHKVVAERGSWAANRHNQGHEQFCSGNYEAALWHYGQCAMYGDEVCQLNAAWMLSEAWGYYGSDHDKLSVSFWRAAADQGSAHAQRILGDLAYSNVISGGANEAIRRYQQAADKADAQALFNLGYMHQWGPVPDLFLAKRAYDQAKQASSVAFVPVQLALIFLSLHMWWVGSPPSGTVQARTSTTLSSFASFDYAPFENILLLFLCAALAIVVYIRQQRLVRQRPQQ